MITRFLPTTIKDVEQDKLNYVVFPNPSNGQLTIKTIAAEKNNFFTITDLGGKEVYTFKLEQRSATTIDVSFLSNGMYLLKDAGAAKSTLFIKE